MPDDDLIPRPPVLYWSPSLALATHGWETDPLVGLIDATSSRADMWKVWCEDGWAYPTGFGLPADAVRLVVEDPVEALTHTADCAIWSTHHEPCSCRGVDGHTDVERGGEAS